MKNLVRFDWAIKRLLRNKADFIVVEGFLSELLGEDIKIEQVLESEGNKTSFENKTNVVDILVQNSKGDLIIIEVQNDDFPNYMLRMLFGTSKLINDTLNRGVGYGKIKKIISVNIVYFQLGQGEDYVYHGTTNFVGIHKKDVLKLSEAEQRIYHTENICDIYPEYFIIKVNYFNEVAVNTLDEWVKFLKTEEVSEHTKAKGLKEVAEKMKILGMSKEERLEYERYLTSCDDSYELIHGNFNRGKMEGKMEEKFAMVTKLKQRGFSLEMIVKLTGLSEKEIAEIN